MSSFTSSLISFSSPSSASNLNSLPSSFAVVSSSSLTSSPPNRISSSYSSLISLFSSSLSSSSFLRSSSSFFSSSITLPFSISSSFFYYETIAPTGFFLAGVDPRVFLDPFGRLTPVTLAPGLPTRGFEVAFVCGSLLTPVDVAGVGLGTTFLEVAVFGLEITVVPVVGGVYAVVDEFFEAVPAVEGFFVGFIFSGESTGVIGLDPVGVLGLTVVDPGGLVVAGVVGVLLIREMMISELQIPSDTINLGVDGGLAIWD